MMENSDTRTYLTWDNTFQSTSQDTDCSSNSSSGDDSHDVPTQDKQGSLQNNPRRRRHRLSPITYEEAAWFIFIALTLLSIIDRFTTNLWPRQFYSIGAGSAGSDRPYIRPGPWAVKAYDVIARISGRHGICCFNLLLVTRFKSLEYFLANSAWINRYLIDCSDIINANIRLHRWNAIVLCILTIIHVWSILFPCFFHGYSAQVVPGTFEFPLSERKPKGFKDANLETETMSMQVDDVWRLIEMTIMLGILTPLSVRWLATRWHVGMPLHQFIMVLYFVDIVRRHTHPHSWILNTPFFVLWILDKVFQQYWKRCSKPGVQRIKLDDKYMVLLWDTGNISRPDTVGLDYYLKLNDSSWFESRHIFTTFQNRLGLQLGMADDGNSSGLDDSPNSTSLEKEISSAGTTWTAATVIRVFDKKRTPQLGKKDPISHTKRIYETNPNQLALTVWGPVPGEMSGHVKNALLDLADNGDNCSCTAPVVLVGAGSGIGYMLDALQYYQIGRMKSSASSSLSSSVSFSSSSAAKGFCGLKILFTTRSPGLFRWVEEMIWKIFPRDDRGNCYRTNNNHVRVVLALTGSPAQAEYDDLWSEYDDLWSAVVVAKTPGMTMVQNFGRIDFEDEIPAHAMVFCQGGLALKKSLEKTCRLKSARFFGGRGGGS